MHSCCSNKKSYEVDRDSLFVHPYYIKLTIKRQDHDSEFPWILCLPRCRPIASLCKRLWNLDRLVAWAGLLMPATSWEVLSLAEGPDIALQEQPVTTDTAICRDFIWVKSPFSKHLRRTNRCWLADIWQDCVALSALRIFDSLLSHEPSQAKLMTVFWIQFLCWIISRTGRFRHLLAVVMMKTDTIKTKIPLYLSNNIFLGELQKNDNIRKFCLFICKLSSIIKRLF